MAIEVHCPCGRRRKVRGTSAGKRVRCPECGEAVRIPEAPQEEIPAVECWKCSSLNENLLILTPSAFIKVKLQEHQNPDAVIVALQGGARPEDVLDGSQTVILLDG